MQLYRKILLTIDCSEVDAPIVEHVSALARQNDAAVVLMHVIHSHTLDQDRALREKADIAMEQLLSTMKEAGVNAISIIKSGEPEKVLLEEIENGSYDLVAMATHGHTFLGDILFGSVSDSLKHKISVPLLLLRSE
jgi:nucleotide-binding universal stress UspA family protein